MRASLVLALTAAAFSLSALCAAQESGPEAATTQAATTQARTSAPATAASQGADHGSRIAANFLTLMGNNWGEAAWFAGKCAISVIVWSAVALFVGIATGVVVFLLLRGRKLFQAPWGWYRYVRWLWGVVFIVAIAGGMAVAGGWLGLERQLKHSIIKDRVLDKIAGNLIMAVLMDSAEYQATGKETAEQLQQVLADSEAVGQLATKDLAEAMSDVAAENHGTFEQFAVRVLGGATAEKMITDALKVDPRVAVVLFYGGGNIDQYLKDHPAASPPVIALSVQFDELRGGACGLVQGFTRPSIWGWLAGGFGVPLALLGLFRITVRLWGRPTGKAT